MTATLTATDVRTFMGMIATEDPSDADIGTMIDYAESKVSEEINIDDMATNQKKLAYLAYTAYLLAQNRAGTAADPNVALQRAQMYLDMYNGIVAPFKSWGKLKLIKSQ
jgi:hypothetical protein